MAAMNRFTGVAPKKAPVPTMAQVSAAANVFTPRPSAAPAPIVEYQDASGKVITKAEYDALMNPKPQVAPPPIYQDAHGNPITKAQYDQLNALAKAPPVPQWVSTPPIMKPQVIVKKLPKKGVNGLGADPAGVSAIKPLLIAGLAFFVYKAIIKAKNTR